MIAGRDVPGWVPLQTEGRGTHHSRSGRAGPCGRMGGFSIRASWTLRKGRGGFVAARGKLDIWGGGGGGGYATYCLINSLLH